MPLHGGCLLFTQLLGPHPVPSWLALLPIHRTFPNHSFFLLLPLDLPLASYLKEPGIVSLGQCGG